MMDKRKTPAEAGAIFISMQVRDTET